MRKRLRRSSTSQLVLVLGNLIQNGMDGARGASAPATPAVGSSR
jgi:hypothetical protein